jgi:hypothetical protein
MGNFSTICMFHSEMNPVPNDLRGDMTRTRPILRISTQEFLLLF